MSLRWYVLIGLLLILWPPAWLQAQENHPSLRGQPVSANRYEAIKNSPYLFPDWTRVSIIPSSGPPIEDVLMNFNGYTQNFEVRLGEQIIEVELGYFIGIRLEEEDTLCGRQSFLKYYHPKLINKYPLFVFNGRKHRLIKDFRVRLNETKVETPGKTEKFNSFGSFSAYYLMTGADLEAIRLNRKDILKRFPSPAAADFVDTQGIDLETEAGLCRFLTWWDTQP